MKKCQPISGTAAPNAAPPNAAVSEARPLGSAFNAMELARQ